MTLQVAKNVAIIPDSEIVAVTSEKEFVAINVEHYPAGEPMIKEIPDDIDSLIVRPNSMDSFLAAMFLIDVLWDRANPDIHLVLPYFPGARQDRLTEGGDLLFTARSVARLVNNTSNLWQTSILDPHSDVVPALLDRQVQVFDAAFAWGPEHDWSSFEYDGVIAPDGGAVKRALKVAELLGVEVLHGWKRRDVTSGEIAGFGLEVPRKAGHYLVVDDICDGGGTFLGLAKEFDKYGITADLFVTHGIFSSVRNLSMLKKNYDTIYTTDSRVGLHDHAEFVHVIPTVERMI